MSYEMIIQVHTLTCRISVTHGPRLHDRCDAEADDHSCHASTDVINKNEPAADAGVAPVDDADAGVATMCAGYAGVVPINTADAGTASVNTAGAGAAPVNAEYPGVTHVSTTTQMKAPDVIFPAKIPGVVRKIKPSSTDMDERCTEQ